MKHLLHLSILLLVFGSSPVFGQWGIKISTMIPSGHYYPYLLKPGLGIELSGKASFNDDNPQYKIGAAFGYYWFKPTQDTFATYAIGPQLLPGYEVIHSYSILQAGITNDFRILKDGNFSPIVGCNLFIDVFDISHDDYTETLSNASTTNDTFYNWAIVPKIGVQYQLNPVLISAGLERSMGFGGQIGSQAFWEPYISVIFQSRD